MDWKNMTLKSVLKMNKEKLIFIFCSGLLLFVLSLPGDSDSVVTGSVMGSGSTTGTERVAEVGSVTGTWDEAEEGTAYETATESRIRAILSGVEGVGGVDVMVALKSSEENVLRVDNPEISGIIISADGGGNAVVKAEISEAMEALFGLPAHKIKVLKRVKKESEE